MVDPDALSSSSSSNNAEASSRLRMPNFSAMSALTAPGTTDRGKESLGTTSHLLFSLQLQAPSSI